MKFSRKFSVFAREGKIIVTVRVIVPPRISLRAARVEIQGVQTPSLKQFDLYVSNEKIFSGECIEGKRYAFDPPIKLPAGWPTFELHVHPYEEGVHLAGKFKLNLAIG